MASNNPFADAFKSFYENVPSLDVNEAINLSRRNIDAATAACQAFAEGIQAISQRQFEIAQSNVEGALELWKQIASSRDPKEGAARQADFAKNFVEKSISDTREIAEIASKSSSRVAEVVNRQIAECMRECSKVASSSSGYAEAAGQSARKKQAA